MLTGLPISVLGLALRGWASGHLAKDQQLATTGPYAYLRNPLYAGTLIVALGMVLAARSPWLAVIAMASFGFVYFPAIALEEQHLSEIFPQYADYAKRVHRFLPRGIWNENGSRARFSWTLYRRNEEYKALIGFVLAVAWLFWKISATKVAR
jgi:protein-S-isoprenylcysteine O-methyltransferase Ste14